MDQYENLWSNKIKHILISLNRKNLTSPNTLNLDLNGIKNKSWGLCKNFSQCIKEEFYKRIC
jgi:hypothetical protein